MTVVHDTSMSSPQNQSSITDTSDDCSQSSRPDDSQAYQIQKIVGSDLQNSNDNNETPAWKLASIMRLAGVKTDDSGFKS